MTEVRLLTRQRRFVTPAANETLEALAARALPETPVEAAMQQVRAWNLHVFAMRKPRGMLLGSDVIFVEAPIVTSSIAQSGLIKDL